jgi:hypothetical protein
MINRSRRRNFAQERQCAEQDVKDAFERWVLSEKARKRLKQPYFAREDEEPQHSRASMHSSYHGHVRGDAKEKGPVYEKVDGVVMDSRPGYSASPYEMEQTLPEIEAHDICNIQDRSTNKSAGSPVAEDDRATLSPSSTDSTSGGIGASPQLWSESSGSSSTVSTDNGVPKPYRHISTEFTPSVKDDQVREQTTGSRNSDAPSISELDGGQFPLAELQSANAVTAHIFPLEALDDEKRIYVANSQASNATPALHAKGVRDGVIMGSQSKPPATSKRESVTPVDFNAQDATSHGHLNSPPRVLGAAGIGADGHVYELEAVVPVIPSTNPTSPSTTHDDNDSTVNGPNVFAKLEHGISRAAHAVRLKVKKNVTFSPVDDVRFMTPSPHPSSMDTTTGVEVEPEC